MSGSDGVFNIAKGKVAYYAGLPASNDALIAVPLEASGLEADDTLNNYDTLSALLAAANNEQSTMGRKTLTVSAPSVDDTNNRVDMDASDITWTAATGNAIAKIVICYDPDTTGGTDADLVPLTYHTFDATPDGSDITATVTNFSRAS